jgi:hypothetical protein
VVRSSGDHASSADHPPTSRSLGFPYEDERRPEVGMAEVLVLFPTLCPPLLPSLSAGLPNLIAGCFQSFLLGVRLLEVLEENLHATHGSRQERATSLHSL